MLTDTYRVAIHAQPDTIWQLLPQWLQAPEMYIHQVDSIKIVEQTETRVVREISWRGTVFRDKAFIDNDNRRINHELQEHPLYEGRYVTSIVPTSVQNPMAPVELQVYLELKRRSFKVERMVQTEAELAADISSLLESVKKKAEKREHELEGRGQHLSEGVTHR